VRNSVIEVGSIIAGEITILLKKLLGDSVPGVKPITITVHITRDLPVQIFAFLLDMVKKARSTYGVTHSESRFLDIIAYTKENQVVRDISHLWTSTEKQSWNIFQRHFRVPGKEMQGWF